MRSVICFQDLKNAALYFDRVLPVSFRRMKGTGSDIVTEFPEPISSQALINIVFDTKPKSGNARYTDFGRIIDGWDDFSNRIQPYWNNKNSTSIEADYTFLRAAYLANASAPGIGNLRKHFSHYAASLGVQDAAVLLPAAVESSLSGVEDPVVSLTNVNLIDPERATWDQILELRSDAESRLRLQRLRAFVTDRYEGKSRAYVEDDLYIRMDEYEKARRKHGFETLTGSISTLIDSSNIQAAVSAGLATALLGGPWLGASSAALVELGKFSVEFAKRRRAMIDWHDSHPLAYLIQLQAVTK